MVRAAVDLEGGVAEKEQAAERDDEGWNAGIGDEQRPGARPISGPAASIARQVIHHVAAPSIGRDSVCSSAPKTPMKPICEPTERSIWRETMTSTMPHAMMPTTATCSDRLKRLRAVRKMPPVRTSRPSQIDGEDQRAWRAAGHRARRPAPRLSDSALRRIGSGGHVGRHVRHWQAGGGFSVTPSQSSSLLIHLASTTRLRLSRVMPIGVSRIAGWSCRCRS